MKFAGFGLNFPNGFSFAHLQIWTNWDCIFPKRKLIMLLTGTWLISFLLYIRVKVMVTMCFRNQSQSQQINTRVNISSQFFFCILRTSLKTFPYINSGITSARFSKTITPMFPAEISSGAAGFSSSIFFQ